MDIQIISAELTTDQKSIIVERTFDGQRNLTKMPKETLAIRAAEYDLDPEDPRVLDIVLMEQFHEPEDPEEIHPLYAAPTVAEALAVVEKRIEQVKTEHGAPAGRMRSLFAAASSPKATPGLGQTKDLLLAHADKEIGIYVKIHRDQNREALVAEPADLKAQMREGAMAIAHSQATAEAAARAAGSR